jgi:ribonucleoside-triphosphate reductase
MGDLVTEYIKGKDWLIKENSNQRYSFTAMQRFVAGEETKAWALKNVYSPELSRAHKGGDLHIHDLGFLGPYCNGMDARLVFTDGLRFPNVNSKPAKHFSSAINQLVAFMSYTQHHFAGAQSFDWMNWFLAPYVAHDPRVRGYDDVKQEVQSLFFTLNQYMRAGSESPFTNVGLRITIPESLKDEKAVFAGGKRADTYSDYEEQARMIYKAFCEIMREGDGKGRPFTFPLTSTAITADIFEDPLWEETMKTTARNGSFYFLNLRPDYMGGDTTTAMCCRMRVEHEGGIWTAGGVATGSNRIITINLPRIGFLSKGSVKRFYTQLDKVLAIARKGLAQGNKMVYNSIYKWGLHDWLTFKSKDGVPYYNFKKRKLTVGVVGMNECLENFKKGWDITVPEAHKLAQDICAYIGEKLDKWTIKDKVEYTFEQTPAESTAHRLAVLDRKKFGNRAKVRGAGKEIYYTNSTHVPYNLKVPLLRKILLEAPFHPVFSGGTMFHLWMGESHPHPAGLSILMQKLSETPLAFWTLSNDFSLCVNGHATKGVHKTCPMCGGKIRDWLSKVTGFYQTISNYNPGKKGEWTERKRYLV